MSSDSDNRVVWDRRAGHYEVWYTTVTHRESRTGFWIRYTLHAPVASRGEPYAQLWFARFSADAPDENFGIHKRFALAAFAAAPPADPFALRIGGAEHRHDGIRGALAGAGHEASWDLRWRPAETTHHHLPALFYKNPLSDTKVLSPNLAVPTEGEIVVDGRAYRFAGERAGQSHVWGKKHAYQWGWSHVVDFDGGRDAAFESITARLKRGAVLLPRMTVFSLYLDGEEHAFREPWKIPTNRADFQTGRCFVIGVSPAVRVEAELTCRAEDTILTEYVDPDGDPAFCHNTCAADAVIQVKRRSPFVGRWRDAERLTATRTAHWEWGARAGDAANVKRWHTLIAEGARA